MATENILVRLGLEVRDYVTGAGKAAKATSSIAAAGDEVNASTGRQRQSLRDLASSYGTAVKAAAGLYVASKVKDFTSSSITAYTNLSESLNAVSVQFGDAGRAITDFGETAATQVGLSNAEFNQLSVTTGALLSNFIDNADDAAAETIRLTQRAADMASVFNTEVPEALTAVQAAIRGETEPIRRFGVVLDDASIRAKAVSLGLAATTKEVTAQQKGLAALELIYEQTNKTAGDFLNTSDGLANRQRVFAARLEDTKAAIGEALEPALISLLDAGEELLPVLENLAPAIGKLVSGFASLVASADGVINFFADGATAAGALFQAIADGNLDAVKYAKAQDAIVQAQRGGEQQAQAFADAISYLSREGALNEQVLADLAKTTEFEGEQQAVALRMVIDSAKARGDSVESIRALEDALVKEIDATDRTAKAKQELIETLGLEEAAHRQGVDPIGDMRQAYIDEQNAADEAREAIRNEAFAAAKAARDRPGQTGTVESMAEAFQRLADEQRDATRAQKEAVDPVFALLSAQRKLDTAAERYNQALRDFGPEAAETEDALVDLFEAQIDLESATAGAAGKIGTARGDLNKLADVLGISREEVERLISALGRLPTQADINVHTRYTSSGTPPPARVLTGTQTTSTIRAYAEGGRFAAQQPILVGERGPELLVPNSSGTIIPNHQLTNNNSTTIYLEGRGDTVEDISLALAMAGVQEEIEIAGNNTLRR